MADVFVSYKKEDRALAERLIEWLRTEGFSVWWDDNLTPRTSWDSEIEREASGAKAIVVLWTPRSVQSDWVRAEADFGKEAGKLVPVLLEPTNIPLSFRLIQAADLTQWDGRVDHLQWRKLVQWIGDLVSAEPEHTDAAPETTPTPRNQITAPPKRRGSLLIGVFVIAALATLGAAAALILPGLINSSETGDAYVARGELVQSYFAGDTASCENTGVGTFYDVFVDQCIGCTARGMKRTVFPIESDKACQMQASDGGGVYSAAVAVGPPSCTGDLFRKPGTTDCHGCPVGAAPNPDGRCEIGYEAR
ncbi:MAG: toll/interleukin-1 receptor domain-containing protein [Pseudomonadota bacterium]